MLSLIFGSEERAKLFSLLLLQTDKSFKIKQFSEETGLSLAMIRKELNLLNKFGLVLEKNKSWQVNPDFILFSELKSLIMKAQILSSQKFIENLKKISDPLLFILTGCFTNDPMAKTDILLVGTVKRRAFLKLIADLENSLNREINYTIMDEEEFVYRQEVMDIFLYNIMTGKNIILIDKISKFLTPVKTASILEKFNQGFIQVNKIRSGDNINEIGVGKAKEKVSFNSDTQGLEKEEDNSFNSDN